MTSLDKLDSFILDKMCETRLPGVSLAAVKGGKVVYSRGYGLRDVARGKPATPDTIYCIGSITKSFTCIAVMQLVEKGLLSVDDPLEKHLLIKLHAKGKPVKISHLMSHTSGIPATAYAEAAIRNVMKAADTYMPLASGADMYTFLDGAEEWANNAPGERWYYLNEGFRLLGEVVEKVSGEKYVDYVRAHILDPLGMARSTFSPNAVEADPDAATPYIVTRTGEQLPSTYPYGIVGSDGGIVSSATEMAEYLKMLLNKGKVGRKQVLSAASLAEMTKPRIKTPDQPWITKTVRHYGYGLGINVDPSGPTTISHGGSVSTATAQLAIIPEENIGVIVLANGTGYPLATIADYALAALAGRDPDQLPAIRFENTLTDLAGNYET
ncbi:TPA: beta-lactamase family protein, partial [Candidatus Bathyarchaeota archaeon]|nr:beta-lactamase family protein [Candidatus Bathyarchaeota archaeon]